MANTVSSSLFFSLMLVLSSGAAVSAHRRPSAPLLRSDYYKESCPNVEKITYESMEKLYHLLSPQVPSLPAAVLQIFFHDCFVQGCDASILAPQTVGNHTERDSPNNFGLLDTGFRLINESKAALEAECPGVVSCADIIAIATRDVVHKVGGPIWDVLKGRRDVSASKFRSADRILPRADNTFEEVLSRFNSKGLTASDLATLLGAHTIGFAGCTKFENRLSNFNATFDYDPLLSHSFAMKMRVVCKVKQFSPFDRITPLKFDNVYYKGLEKHRGILAIDSAIYADPRTRQFVKEMAADQQLFFSRFAKAMVKLGNLGVKTAPRGMIREHCDWMRAV